MTLNQWVQCLESIANSLTSLEAAASSFPLGCGQRRILLTSAENYGSQAPFSIDAAPSLVAGLFYLLSICWLA